MSEKVSAHLHEALELSGKMMDLAERGVEGCQDDGCLVVYGILRDCAYKVRTSAEKELQEHGLVNLSVKGERGEGVK